MLRRVATLIGIVLLSCSVAPAASNCAPDGVQASGSIWRICMPAPEAYNGRLIIFAHGLQTPGTPVSIPEDQLELSGLAVAGFANNLGFGFATASYSKTGLAVRQGYDDLLDLVQVFSAREGVPERVYLIGASMGGQIATLLQEDHPAVFDATMAVCAPIGDFTAQLDYFGHGRVLFDYFFPGLIPGPTFDPPAGLIAGWPAFYNQQVRPKVLALYNRPKLNQLVRTANLPVSPTNYLQTAESSVHALLDFAILQMGDTIQTLGGMPFDNRLHWYAGSWNDVQLNMQIARFDAEPVALQEIHQYYDTRGDLTRPLITMHTLLDEVVPYHHEVRYTAKTLLSPPSWFNRVHVPVVRYGHCNFNLVDGALAVALLLQRAGDLHLMFGLESVLGPAELESFEERAAPFGIPYEIEGEALGVVLIEP